MHRILTDKTWSLHGIAASRQLEHLAAAGLPPHTLMQRAGLAVARLARAIAPHARQIWIACGPGNNGGDGFEAALHLQNLGLDVHLNWTGADREPDDARASRLRAQQAGVQIRGEPPEDFDLAIDALLGLGADFDSQRPATATMLSWLERMHRSDSPLLAVDLPSGLNADTGTGLPSHARQTHTLSLLTLKAGLFTGRGRDLAGQVWYDSLDVDTGQVTAQAQLIGAEDLQYLDKANGPQDSHKGSYGDLWVIGGGRSEDITMVGAALLAARAALRAGAGRVYLSPLGQSGLSVDSMQPELMWRSIPGRHDLKPGWTLVCGCGGGQAVAQVLPDILACPGPLVLDADALNAIAAEPALRRQLGRRRGRATILTPHPLEAARLLDCTAAQVQSDRIRAARTLADEWGCTVVLKGSGTVIASGHAVPGINPSGNPLLATAGTGDVLAGMIGAALARGMTADAAARLSVHQHGALADAWAASRPGECMVASDLLQARSLLSRQSASLP